MIYLWITTFIWAFSFPIIGYFVSGKMDSYFAIFIRAFLAFLVFLPFIKWQIQTRLKLTFMGIGALQIGFMYMFYYNSFKYLSVSEVALFTIFTPFYVSLFYDMFSKKLRLKNLLSISIAVFGAYIIKSSSISDDFILGFVLIQCANIVFALAQSFYKYSFEKHNLSSHKEVFGYFFLGASIVSLLAFFILGKTSLVPTDIFSWTVLVYLGVVASSLGYFLWGKGSVMVDSGTLAMMNNAIIPVAIIVNLVFFKVDTNLYTLAIGVTIMIIASILHHKLKI